MSSSATRWLARGAVSDPLAPPPSVLGMVVAVPPPVLGVPPPGAVVGVVPAPGAPFGGWNGFLLPKTSNVSSGAGRAVVVVVEVGVGDGVTLVTGGDRARVLPLPPPPRRSGFTTKNSSIATARKAPRTIRARRFGSRDAARRRGVVGSGATGSAIRASSLSSRRR